MTKEVESEGVRVESNEGRKRMGKGRGGTYKRGKRGGKEGESSQEDECPLTYHKTKHKADDRKGRGGEEKT